MKDHPGLVPPGVGIVYRKCAVAQLLFNPNNLFDLSLLSISFFVA
jgi:hypothetical protein